MFSRRRSKMVFRKKKRKVNFGIIILFSLVIVIILFLYFINARLMPVFLEYAEVQTQKVASYVISNAINARTTSVLDVNDIIEEMPEGSNGMIAAKFNTEIINQVQVETTTLVKQFLEQAERGNLTHLPNLENVEYDVGKMEAGDGIVFFVPLSQAANLPILGNLGPKIPIRFHIIGNVNSDVETRHTDFGINNAIVEVILHVEVNVQIIVPFASKSATVEKNIPVAIGLVSGRVPHIYTNGSDGAQPSIEVPVPLPDDE